MDLSKLKNKFLIVLCLFVLFMPFYLITFVYADSEDVEVNTANLSINSTRNYFISSDTGTVGYFTVEKGYIYHMHNRSTTSERLVVTCNSSPAVNVPYTIIASIPVSGDYDYIATNDTTLYISYNASSQVSVTREKLSNMDGTISELVNNVGPNGLWSIFEIAVDYIWVVVLVAFGIFIITRIIKKFSKAKGGM